MKLKPANLAKLLLHGLVRTANASLISQVCVLNTAKNATSSSFCLELEDCNHAGQNNQPARMEKKT